MASAAFPSIIAAVVTVAQTALAAEDVRVVRGLDLSGEPSDVVLVGVPGPDTSGYVSAGTFQQSMQTFGGGREEVGVVNGLVASLEGGGDPDVACSTAFDYLALIEAAIRADQTLGLTAFDYVVAELQSGDVSEAQSDYGATTAVSFAIAYKVRI